MPCEVLTMNNENQEQSPSAVNSPQPGESWEREVLSRLAFAAIDEQRRTRRWNVALKIAFLGYLVLLLVLYLPWDWLDSDNADRHTALINVEGVIATDSDASADRIITGLRAAFEDENTAGVILRINSPGGSPVQSGYINDEIERLRGLHKDTPLYAVLMDVSASGGYYIAAAADKIYADKASIVGSIGVVMNSFGFVDAMGKIGVERRLFTAGNSKGLLDPFSPLRVTETEHIQTMLESIHRQFIATVRKGRGARLKEHPDLYTGLIWTGEQGLALGLVDALGSSSYVAREIIGAQEIVDFTPKRSLVETVANRIGAQMVKTFATQLGLGTPQFR